MSNKSRRSTFRAFAEFTQLGINMVTPMILCIIIAYLLQQKFGLGSWVMILAILLGAGGGYASLLRFIEAVKKKQKEDNDAE